jgi:hypothetical protein
MRKQDSQELLQIDPAHIRHFLSIFNALSPEEAAQVREIAQAFSPAELRAWFAQLVDLNEPQAIQHIRVLVAGTTEAVS